MKEKLLDYLNKNKIISNSQFGFRPGLNTFDAINKFTSDLYSALDDHKSIISIFIDFSKAFDTVQHNILLDKLHHYGIMDVFTNGLSHIYQTDLTIRHLTKPPPASNPYTWEYRKEVFWGLYYSYYILMT